MKLGFCYIAEHSEPGRAVPEIIEAFGRTGIVLVNPFSGRITALAEDGDQRDATQAGLIREGQTRGSVSFQLWFSSDTDVRCHVRRLKDDLVCHVYSVSGLDADERRRLIKWAIDYFRDAVDRGTGFLLAVDPVGRTADVDWDLVATQRIGLPNVLPSVFGMPASWAKHLPALSGYVRERVGAVELFTAQPSGQ